MVLHDIVWAVISLIELATRLNTLVQVDLVVSLSEEEVSLLHKVLQDRSKEIEIYYYPGLLTMRVYPKP